ncbi:hypothetical protein FGF66_11655 [Chlorobaculum thiosulfatiphilum]|uniref:SoxXA-binding protein SoxK n=2 Tax=Chlorobiaceae TaxID=191412 RepID=Q8RLW9_CHLLI|nr:hypothetical protein [Chlorobaculum thiosulfatiphilum]AAL68887.1 unknown [Chlorobium limicola]TNJ36573.1 hypothetical protein FGF66_11655 [Chlorobaculum thiosulfatiphilum]
MKKVLSLLSLLLLTPSASLLLAEPTAAPAVSSPLIDQAEAARKEADALGYEWRDTGALIQSAKDALQKGQQAESDKLASQALFQARAATAQGQYMAKNWKMMIPKN